MWICFKKLLLCFAVLQIFGQFVKIEGKAVLKNGKKKSFGAGLIAGGLAGAAVSHLINQNVKTKEIHHTDEPNSAVLSPIIANPIPAQSKPITTIEKVETLPNGCYKQIFKEPDHTDITRFIETEQLLCPQNLPKANAQTFVHLVPVVTIQLPEAAAVPGMHIIQVPVVFKPADPTQISGISLATAPTTEPVYTAPLQPLQTNSSAYVQTTTNNTLPQPVVENSVQPVGPPSSVTTGPLQVIILSKKTGFYGKDENKSSAKGLFANYFSVFLSVIVVLISI